MKKEIITGAISLCTAATTYMELGREFESGDYIHGKVGLIYKIGRIGIKISASYLAFVFSDAIIGGAVNHIAKAVNIQEDSVKEEEGGDNSGESNEDS